VIADNAALVQLGSCRCEDSSIASDRDQMEHVVTTIRDPQQPTGRS